MGQGWDRVAHMQRALAVDLQEGGQAVWMQHVRVVDLQQGDGVLRLRCTQCTRMAA